MAESAKTDPLPAPLSYDDVRAVSPASEHYSRDAVIGVWKRLQLSTPCAPISSSCRRCRFPASNDKPEQTFSSTLS